MARLPVIEIGAMRATLGAILLLYYSSLWPDLSYYFGTSGMVDRALLETPRLSLLFLFPGETAMRLMAAALMLLIILFTLGIHSRVCLWPLFALHLSFHHANPFIIHEPQQLTNLLLVACFALPLDSSLSLLGKAHQARCAPDEADRRIVTLLVAYLGAYYLIAGVKKLPDPLWRSGEALWYLIQWAPLGQDGLATRWLISHPAAARAGAYASLAFELCFVLLAFTRLRPLLLPAGAAFHALIFATLEVGNFPWVLAPWYALLLDDPTRAWFRKAAGTLPKFSSRPRAAGWGL